MPVDYEAAVSIGCCNARIRQDMEHKWNWLFVCGSACDAGGNIHAPVADFARTIIKYKQSQTRTSVLSYWPLHL
jgi:hypothetical protein